MREKKNIIGRIGDFLAGKGFYIVLFVCIVIIGISAGILIFTGNAKKGTDVGSLTSTEKYADNAVITANGGKDASTVSPADNGSAAVFAKDGGKTAAVKPSPASGKASGKAGSGEDEAEGGKAESKSPTFVWPEAGNVEVAFSQDALVYDKTMADWRAHPAIDITADIGSKVKAVADGTVSKIYNDDLLGTTVVIDHGSGLKSVYANLAAKPAVKEGEKVTMASVIGAVGDTAIGETSEATHLHFAMTQDGTPVNPIDYLPAK